MRVGPPVPSTALGGLPQLCPSAGKAPGRDSRSVEMRVDTTATPAPVDLSGVPDSWPEPRYQLPLQAWFEAGRGGDGP